MVWRRRCSYGEHYVISRKTRLKRELQQERRRARRNSTQRSVGPTKKCLTCRFAPAGVCPGRSTNLGSAPAGLRGIMPFIDRHCAVIFDPISTRSVWPSGHQNDRVAAAELKVHPSLKARPFPSAHLEIQDDLVVHVDPYFYSLVPGRIAVIAMQARPALRQVSFITA